MKNNRCQGIPRNNKRVTRKAKISAFPVRISSKNYAWDLLREFTTENRSMFSNTDLTLLTQLDRVRTWDKFKELQNLWSHRSMGPDSERVFFARYQATALLKKFIFPANIELAQATGLKKFELAEENCKCFNNFQHLKLTATAEQRKKLDLMRRFIVRVIGESPNLDAIADNARHGPGSTLSSRKGRITSFYKFSELPYTVTNDCLPYAKVLIKRDARWLRALMCDFHAELEKREPYFVQREIKPGPTHDWKQFWSYVVTRTENDRITFVDKSADEKRTITVTPLLNMMFQLGVDKVIRSKLKKFGCNLDSQAKNQLFSYLGTTLWDNRQFSTIDLRGASDHISNRIVAMLFPHDWWVLLDDLRSRFGVLKIDGSNRSYQYEKFSAMGNGFTFVIESLIFLAAAYAAMRSAKSKWSLKRDVAIFGDDIVVPKDCTSSIIRLLLDMGFHLNNDKTFIDGPFRESCGCDYYNTTPVRPFFITAEPKNMKELFQHINSLRLLNERNKLLGLATYDRMLAYLLLRLPSNADRFIGPPSSCEFDTYLHVPLTVAKSVYKLREKYSMYGFRRLLQVPRDIPKGRHKRPSGFYFRSLMSNLKGHPESAIEVVLRRTPEESDKLKFVWLVKPWMTSYSDGGNAFLVTHRNSMRYKQKDSFTSFWFENYEQLAWLKKLHAGSTLN